MVRHLVIRTGKPIRAVWYEKQSNESQDGENEIGKHNYSPVEKTRHYRGEQGPEYGREVCRGHDHTPKVGLGDFSGVGDAWTSNVRQGDYSLGNQDHL